MLFLGFRRHSKWLFSLFRTIRWKASCTGLERGFESDKSRCFMHTQFISGNKRFFVFAAFICSAINASATLETLVPLPRSDVGIINGNKLGCFRIALDQPDQWEPCESRDYQELPADVTRVLGNESRVAIIAGDHVDFFDDDGHLRPNRRITFSIPVRPESFVNGANSTESEVTRIDGGRLIVSNSAAPDNQFNIALTCKEAEGHKIYDFGEQSIAIVDDEQVQIRELKLTPHSVTEGAACSSSTTAHFNIPEGADEVFVFQRQYIGVRQGRKVQFFVFDPSVGWISARTSTQKNVAALPDLQLP